MASLHFGAIRLEMTMNLRSLRDALSDISALVRESGGKKSADEIAAIATLLEGEDTAPVGNAIENLAAKLENEKETLRQDYVQRLLESELDDQRFAEVYQTLSDDRRVGKEDVDAIANIYTKGRPKWGSRKAALAAIQDKFEERAYQRSKMKIVEGYKVG
jgi:hypothetical protein